MVSTENITDANKPEVGTEVDITSTDAFPNLPEQKLQIVELMQLALAGVPIFYTFVLDGPQTKVRSKAKTMCCVFQSHSWQTLQ